MADQSASSSFTTLQHNPGNSLFPTLPGAGDPNVGYLGDWLTGASQLFPFFEDKTGVVQSATGTPRTSGFGDWFLNQVWVTPDPIDFGDIADAKDVAVTFFSTWLEPVVIDSLSIPVDGVDITDPTGSPLFPTTLDSYNDTIFTFTAAQSGPQTFDDEITITVEGSSFEVRVLGRRVLLLFAEPQNGSIETLNWATDLMRSKDGVEQAFSLRLAPFSVIRYTLRHSADLDWQRTTIEALLMGGTPVLPFGVQLWYEAEKITTSALSTDTTVNIDTRYMQIAAGESFVFTTPSRENILLEIDSFTATDITFTQAIGTALPVDTYGMPVRYGHLQSNPTLTTGQKNLQDTVFDLRTEADIDIGDVDANYFDFHTVESPARPILRKRGIRNDSARGLIYRETQELDSITGRKFVTGTESMGEWLSDLVVYCNSKAEIRAWREFLHYMRGTWGKFYLPSFQNDLPLDSPIALGGNSFDVPYMGIAAFLNGVAPYRDLRIQLQDGSVEYKRITLVTDNGDGTETITVDSVIGSVGFSSVADTVISWMRLVRIEADTARFLHRYIGQADLEFTVRSTKE